MFVFVTLLPLLRAVRAAFGVLRRRSPVLARSLRTKSPSDARWSLLRPLGIFQGTVTKSRVLGSSRLYYIAYDDGDDEELEECVLIELLNEGANNDGSASGNGSIAENQHTVENEAPEHNNVNSSMGSGKPFTAKSPRSAARGGGKSRFHAHQRHDSGTLNNVDSLHADADSFSTMSHKLAQDLDKFLLQSEENKVRGSMGSGSTDRIAEAALSKYARGKNGKSTLGSGVVRDDGGDGDAPDGQQVR